MKTKTDCNTPGFNFKTLVPECQVFIANTLWRKPRTEQSETRHWWDNYPEADTVQYDNNTTQYLPKYK